MASEPRKKVMGECYLMEIAKISLPNGEIAAQDCVSFRYFTGKKGVGNPQLIVLVVPKK